MTINFNYDTGNMGFVGTVMMLLVLVIMFAAMWRIFVKGGEHGWAVFIPFYGNYCQFRMFWGNGWLFLLMFVPLVNFVIMVMTYYKMAKCFGKGIGFMLGLMFLPFIFLPILGFGDAEYIGLG